MGHITIAEAIDILLLAFLCISAQPQGNAGFGYCATGFSSALARGNLLVAGLPGVQQSVGKNEVAL